RGGHCHRVTRPDVRDSRRNDQALRTGEQDRSAGERLSSQRFGNPEGAEAEILDLPGCRLGVARGQHVEECPDADRPEVHGGSIAGTLLHVDRSRYAWEPCRHTPVSLPSRTIRWTPRSAMRWARAPA